MNASLKSLAVFLGELRHSVRTLGLLLFSCTLLLFFVSNHLLVNFQHHLGEHLYFFTVAGPFLAHVKIAFFSALYLLMPYLLYVLWKAMGKPFRITGRRLTVFVVSTSLLFYIGTLFCYLVTLPYGIQFLLSFQSQNLHAVISISRFVNFVLVFVLGFGLVFELPVFMVFTSQVGLIPLSVYIRNRRYAILIIAILAAVLTPTPDVVNMALMGVPIYVLYESGILLVYLMQRRARKAVEEETSPDGAEPSVDASKAGDPDAATKEQGGGHAGER